MLHLAFEKVLFLCKKHYNAGLGCDECINAALSGEEVINAALGYEKGINTALCCQELILLLWAVS